MTPRIPPLALGLLILGASISNAAEFCVSDGTSLRAALLFARANGQADIIRMTTGFFAYPGGGTFSYAPTAGQDQNFNLNISGGWTTLSGNACGIQLSGTSAFATVITTGTSDRLMNIVTPINSSMNVTVSRITFLGGGNGLGEAGGLRILGFNNFTGTLRVDQCAFLDNHADHASALRMATSGAGSTVRLSNSLFHENRTNLNTAELEASQGNGVYATNNTVINNTVFGSFGGMHVATSGAGTQAFVANNNLWGNQGVDLDLVGENTTLRNNNIGTRTGATPLAESNNISVVPVYETGTLNFTPAVGSPLRDGGTKPSLFVPIPPRFEDGWIVGSVDVRSHPRLQGPKIDIGAYESDGDIIFIDGFD